MKISASRVNDLAVKCANFIFEKKESEIKDYSKIVAYKVRDSFLDLRWKQLMADAPDGHLYEDDTIDVYTNKCGRVRLHFGEMVRLPYFMRDTFGDISPELMDIVEDYALKKELIRQNKNSFVSKFKTVLFTFGTDKKLMENISVLEQIVPGFDFLPWIKKTETKGEIVSVTDIKEMCELVQSVVTVK